MKLNTAYINWHGTDVCLNFKCECGYISHIDGFFASQIKCKSCENVYKLDKEVKATQISGEEINEPLEDNTPE